MNQRQNNNQFGKIPPQARDLEEVVIGAMLLEKDKIQEIMEILPDPDCFYDEKHKKIYSAIISLTAKGMQVDLLTVKDQLQKSGTLELIGGAFYLTKLTMDVVTSAHALAHARIIMEKYLGREMIKLASSIFENCYSDSQDIFNVIDQAEKGIFDLSASYTGGKEVEHIEGHIMSEMEQIAHKIKHKIEFSGVPTGFVHMDRLTGGWQNTDLVILAARPSRGKCLSRGTKVLMYDGTFREVQDIVIGDELKGLDGTKRTVLSLHSGVDQMYKVWQRNGIEYEVNSKHELVVKRGKTESCHKHGDVHIFSAEDFYNKPKSTQIRHKGFMNSCTFYEEQPLPIDPYFLGVWLGDGNQRSIRVYTPEPEIIDYCKQLADDLGYSFHQKEQKGCYEIGIVELDRAKRTYGSLYSEFRRNGLNMNKHIPLKYIANSEHNRMQLLAGLIDTDGYVGSDGSIEITQKSLTLITEIKHLCNSLGFRADIKEKIGKISSINFEGLYYRIVICGDTFKIPLKVKRKRESLKEVKCTDSKITQIKVTKSKIGEYFGFEIDGDHLFMLSDYTVVHNSALALNWAYNAASDEKNPTSVLLFSLEMSTGQLTKRLMSMSSGVALDAINKPATQMTQSTFMRLSTFNNNLNNCQIFIDDTASITVAQVTGKVRRLKKKRKIGLIIIDYLQLMTGRSNHKSREQEVSGISRDLKKLAKEMNVPVIALSQLNRQVENRPGGKPNMSDLNESGGIEANADIITFLYNPTDEDINENPELKYASFLDFAKHRNGELDQMPLYKDMRIQKFADKPFTYDNLPQFDNPISAGIKSFHETKSDKESIEDAPF